MGGRDTDTLYGGDGNDNLYGTQGYTDAHRDLDGQDVAYGGAGTDWFETGYHWSWTDRDGATDQPLGTQNDLAQDWNYKHYDANGPTGVSSVGIVNVPPSPTTNIPDPMPLGRIGWISTGVTDDQGGVFPPALTHAQRLAIRHGIMDVPANWNLSVASTAGDGVIWYALTRGPQQQELAGISWHYLAVKSGTVLVSQDYAASGEAAFIPEAFGMETRVLPLLATSDIRLAGSATVYHAADAIDALPSDVPANAHGILLGDGVIWLPQEGSAAYFRSSQ